MCLFAVLSSPLFAQQPENSATASGACSGFGPCPRTDCFPLGPCRTADEAREIRAEYLDFSRPKCGVAENGRHLTVRVRGRRNEVVDAIFETMRIYGLALLPENPRVPSENRYIHPDDVHNCYFMWYGLGTDDMMFVQHYRHFPETLWQFTGPHPIWDADAFHRLLLSRLSAAGLSRFVRVDRTRVLSREPRFYEEYKESTGPEHGIEYDVNGNLIKLVINIH